MEINVADLFREEVWSQVLPKKYIIPTVTFKLSKGDIQYLTDDETNPDPNQFTINAEVKKSIEELKGAVFAKFAGRSAKDCSNIDRKVTSVKGLVLLVKMSQYLTQALVEDEDGADLILRQYLDTLESELNQYRVYVINGQVIGICQKNPSFLSEAPTSNQLQPLKEIANLVHQSLKKTQKQPIQFVIDLFISPNGYQTYILALEPFHIHALSLFTEQQLRIHQKNKKTKSMIKIVEKQHQLKQIDLGQYKACSELKDVENVKEWIQLMQKQQKAQTL